MSVTVAPVAETSRAPAPLGLPRTLTPSKISAFTSCPLAFRFSVIERLPEPASLPAVRGTLVHRALQLLYTYTDEGARDRHRAEHFLGEAFRELSTEGSELAALGLDAEGRATLLRQAGVLLDRYFEIEDPNSVRPAGLELDLSVEVGGVVLRGIIDRLDVLPDGRFAVVDYKTGRAPRAEQARSRLSGVQLYALLCEEVLGSRPAAVRLIYLRDRVVISAEPSDMSMRGVLQRAGAVWRAIERACEQADFRPSPSPLCSWCGFRQYCPAVGGDPDRPR
ncbi:MAG TPA: PD-(D/E)XK nuclease family protein [Acidimicrobiales bacterium]|nr:PD-(D/E)XK nuclease family protein [Acidimicrobiales bacterium]